MIEWDRAKICGKRHERVYLEAWNIRLHQSSMNRDEGVLLSIYNNPIISEAFKADVKAALKLLKSNC